MKFDPRRLYALLCLSALAVALGYPAWAQLQQSEAYYGYADIRLESPRPPNNAVAGGVVTLPVRISNQGPDRADSPQVVFTADSRLTLHSTVGCVDSPNPNVRCLINALDSGQSRDLAFTGRLQPSARGSLVLGAFGLSEAMDSVPGNEQVLAVVNIRAAVNLQTEVMNSIPQVLPDDNLRWEFKISNQGPSDALSPTVWLKGTPHLQLNCLAGSTNAHCPFSSNDAFLGAGAHLVYELITPTLEKVPNQTISLNIAPTSETETQPIDNTATVTWTSNLHLDGFE